MASAGTAQARTDAAKEDMNQARLRSGHNSAATTAAEATISNNNARSAMDERVNQTVADHDKNVNYQQGLIQAAVSPSTQFGQNYAAATGAQSSALGDLTKAQTTLSPWAQIVQTAIGAAGQAAGAAGKQ